MDIPAQADKVNIPALKEVPIQVALGRIIKQRRNAYRMSQQELAKRAGLTQRTISQLEAGFDNPTIKTIEAIAAVFNQRLEISFKRQR